MKNIALTSIIVLIVFLLNGCGGGGGGGGGAATTTQQPITVFNSNLKPADLKVICTKNTVNPIVAIGNSSDYYLQNNTWGLNTAANYLIYSSLPWSQCINADFSSTNTVVAKWTWDMTSDSSWSGGVKSYPEIIYGYKPAGQRNYSTFPKLIGNVKALKINWDIEVDKNSGTGQILLESWISSNDRPLSNAVSGGTVAELAIILDCWPSTDGWCNPTGEKVNIGGNDYIYKSQNAPLNGNPQFITFNSINSQIGKNGLDMILFMNFLKLRGLLTDQQYIDDVELGTEIILGKGEVRLNAFSVTTN